MSVALIKKDNNTNYCEFSYDNWDLDKDNLPNLDTQGRDKLSTIKFCSQGSFAIGTDGGIKILTGDNEWIDY